MDFLTHPLTLLSLYGAACYVLTFLVRRIVETAKPDLKKQADANDKKITYKTAGARWWNEVILYAIAPVIGVVLAVGLRDTDFFPDQFKSSWTVTLMAGVTVGFLCSLLFKIFKKLLTRAAGVDEADLEKPSDPPEVPG